MATYNMRETPVIVEFPVKVAVLKHQILALAGSGKSLGS